MLNSALIHELKRIVGDDHVSVSRSDSELYSYDASLARGAPGAVVFPADTHEAARAVRAAYKAGVYFVPRGFGTNLSGGTVLPSGGLVICLSRLNRILGIYPKRRCAVVQPGVTNLELQNALAARGFFYAPDPASQKVATLGGNVGENSGGPHCLKYGVTTNHVLGMEMILPDGEITRIGGAALDPPGYDLRGVVVGSEGTLGLVTEVTVRILPKPEDIITMLAIYDSVAQAAQSVSDIIAAGMVPATLEMMDAPIIKAVEDSYACGYPRDAAAVLIIEVEGPAAGLKDQARQIRDLCDQNNCRNIRVAKDNQERNRLWEGRRGAFGAVARLAPNYLVNDCTVPRTRLPEALAQVSEICRKYGFEHGNVFHAGDGNLHPLILFDSRDAGQLDRVHKAGWEIMQACVNLGGTITGEHGVGMEKKAAMRLIFSDEDFEAQRALKAAFDPRDLLNPGKIIPAPEEGSEKQAGLQRDVNPAEEQILERVRKALDERRAVVPTGFQTSLEFGNSGDVGVELIESTGIDEIFELDPANQVVTVGAGSSLKALQQALEVHGQWLPIRPPLSLQRHSVGGMVATGASGPERLAYGAPRDLLLGLRFINGRGHLVQTGGRVVKNVAGYDMTRLLTGTAGTLGFITRVTLRTAMLPQRCTALKARGSLEACSQLACDILQSHLTPVFVTAFTPDQSQANGANMWIGYEGFSETVQDQVARTGKLFEKLGLISREVVDYPVHEGCFGGFYTQLVRLSFILEGDVALDQVADLTRIVREELPGQSILMDFGCGRILVGMEQLTDEAWSRLGQSASAVDGHLLLVKAPAAFKQRHDVFGVPQAVWRLTQRIKETMDPQRLFVSGCLSGKL
jgi:D-lactate dehydrogenase (cytochrome)